MTTCPRRAVSGFTDFFASDALEAAARRTGFVQRTSKLTGTLFLARVTCGAWSDAPTTLAPWAAQVTPVDEQGEGAPEAIQQRLHPRALACRQDMLRPALAKVPAVAPGCHDGLCTAFPKVSLAESTGLALPERRHELLPGSGGSTATAGAQSQAVGDDTNSICGHFALTPWHRPAQRSGDTVRA